MEPRFEIFYDVSRKWRFRLIAPNGEIIATSEAYNSKQSCEGGIAAVKKYASARIVDTTC